MNITIRHVLVPVDFGALSAKLVDFARVIGGSLHADVHLVHMLEQPFIPRGPISSFSPIHRPGGNGRTPRLVHGSR
jgi:hypothetical protein